MTSIRLALAAAPAAQVFAVDSQGNPAFRGARIPSGRYARIERAFACAAGDAGSFVITEFEVGNKGSPATCARPRSRPTSTGAPLPRASRLEPP